MSLLPKLRFFLHAPLVLAVGMQPVAGALTHPGWSSWLPRAAAAVALLAAAAGLPALLAAGAALASYSRTLATGRDAWWLRGAGGRRRGALLLRLLFRAGAASGARALARRMAAAARDKARALARAGAPRNGVVFAGSSTFTYWLALERDMHAAGVPAGVGCVNAGFGGACSRDVLDALDALVLPLQPRVIVYFAGTNDINLFGCEEDAAADFAAFVARVHSALPATRIIFLAATVTPFVRLRGETLVRRFDSLNSLARTFVASPAAGGRVEFVASGEFQARDESYLGDCHHLRPEGHAALARLLAPAVIRALKASEAGK